MALFRSSRRHVFKPTAYGHSPRRRRIPSWLVLMLTGVVLGAGGLLFLQKSYGPVRLTAEQSEQLHQDLNSANIDRQRLQSQLSQHTHALSEVQSQLEQRTAALAQAQQVLTRLQNDLNILADAIPPDPRGTSPGIRAARFRNPQGRLTYRVLLMQDADQARPFNGTMEFIVTGRLPNGRTTTINLPPVNVSLTRYVQLDGTLPLPENIGAREVAIRVMRQGESRPSATRTLRVAP